MKEVELFNRLAQLEAEKLTLSEDIRQLKADVKYHPEDNPSGIASDEIKVIAQAAKLKAKQDFNEKKELAIAVFKKYEELAGEE